MDGKTATGGMCGPCGKFTMMGLAFVCEECGRFFDVPRCLTEEVRMLNSKGVHVRGAGCLRFSETGYIKVVSDHVAFMELFDYERADESKLGHSADGGACFIPKTKMPMKKEPERWEDWVKRNG